jgi:hypothetical protein
VHAILLLSLHLALVDTSSNVVVRNVAVSNVVVYNVVVHNVVGMGTFCAQRRCK